MEDEDKRKKAFPSLYDKVSLGHCCKKMDASIINIGEPVYYIPVFREYRIQNIMSRYGGYAIAYCHWCGSKLPKNLRDTWFDTLEEEYSITAHVDLLYKLELPKEFKSDVWWKKRKL